MRGILVTLALLAAVPACAQHQHGGHQPAQPAQPAAGHGAGHAQGHGAGHAHGAGHGHGMPQGWTVRLDRANANAAQVMFMEMGGGLHAVLGPAGIFYNPQTQGTGAYRAAASFTQNKLSAHPEGYGLFIGGRNLTAENIDYAYFLVRQDGTFTIRHRAGTEVHTLVDWTEHAAVNKPDAQGRATNELAVVTGDFGSRFLVNGQQVAALPANLNTAGQVGLRLNHNIDVMVRGFGVTPAAQ